MGFPFLMYGVLDVWGSVGEVLWGDVVPASAEIRCGQGLGPFPQFAPPPAFADFAPADDVLVWDDLIALRLRILWPASGDPLDVYPGRR